MNLLLLLVLRFFKVLDKVYYPRLRDVWPYRLTVISKEKPTSCKMCLFVWVKYRSTE